MPQELQAKIATYSPKTALGRIVRECLAYLPVEQAAELLEAITRSVVMESQLEVVHIRWSDYWGRFDQDDYGVVSRKAVTDTGVGFIVDAFQNIVELEIMKYHGIGTGTTAEAASQTGLVTELTTQYNPDSTRATGNLAEGATGNIFHTEATNTVDAAVAITEHGVFNQAATGGGVMLDRSLFTAVNLASGDSLLTKYELTCSSGG
jgi:hypothetical protein